MVRTTEPKQTHFGSMLFYVNNGKCKRMEFATEDEAIEFEREMESENKENRKELQL